MMHWEDQLKMEGEVLPLLSFEEQFNFKALQRAVFVAEQLIDETGFLLKNFDSVLLTPYTAGFRSLHDALIQESIRKKLVALKKESSLRGMVESFSLPFFDEQIDELFCATLGVEGPLSERQVRVGILSSLLCPLRQSVGSCFATAPAILVHEEQLILFLEDLKELLYTGKLSRVIDGEEFSVPISPTPGVGEMKKICHPNHPGFRRMLARLDLRFTGGKEGETYLQVLKRLLQKKLHITDNALLNPPQGDLSKLAQIEEFRRINLAGQCEMVGFSSHLLVKTWEFTLASFVDGKKEFSKWNLTSSLGLHPEEKGGIGELVYQHLEKKLDEANKKVDKYQIDYEIAFDQVKTTERLLKNAADESDGRRLKAELQAKVYHLHSCQEMRDEAQDLAENISEFFPFFLEAIASQMQEHFQEIFDAQMQEVQGNQYDDSPAGFRLLYKHGRAHVASWSFIHHHLEYQSALRRFFLSIEPHIIERCEWERGENEIHDLITAIVHHVDSDDFLISAFFRMAKAHQVPLKKVDISQLEKMEKKPWAYTSGGTLQTLLCTYFKRSVPVFEEYRWVESPQELAIYFLDTMKKQMPRDVAPFINDRNKRLLATSPTHAFSLLPGQPVFKRGWEDHGFTYTWLRDEYMEPTRAFYRNLLLTHEEQTHLLQAMAKKMSPLEGHHLVQQVHLSGETLSVRDFCRLLSINASIEGHLFSMLPLITPEQASKIPLCKTKPLRKLGRCELFEYIAESFPKEARQDLYLELALQMRQASLAPPEPMIFADTNWVGLFFAFMIHPATLELGLWRVDRLGIFGQPMREWDLFLHGGIRQEWSLMPKSYEYRAN